MDAQFHGIENKHKDLHNFTKDDLMKRAKIQTDGYNQYKY